MCWRAAASTSCWTPQLQRGADPPTLGCDLGAITLLEVIGNVAEKVWGRAELGGPFGKDEWFVLGTTGVLIGYEAVAGHQVEDVVLGAGCSGQGRRRDSRS